MECYHFVAGFHHLYGEMGVGENWRIGDKDIASAEM